MSGIGLPVALVCVIGFLTIPRKWALLPVLVAALYVPASQELEIGALHFTVLRLLVIAGVVRVISSGESMAGGLNYGDFLAVIWAVWAVFSSIFHREGVWLTRFGEIYTALGLYYLFRVYLRSPEDFERLFKLLCLLFLPLAAAMLLEKLTFKNYFGPLFGRSGNPYLRHGNVRAFGPFVHPITAGTVGAVCLPMALYVWRLDRKLALAGLVGTGLVVFSSRSSGPILTTLSIFGGLALWRIRRQLRLVRWGVVILLVLINFVMQDPIYYLIARIDLAGGSTGWYRANLIRAAIEHLGDWWLVGTDVTSNWAGANVINGTTDVDITNYYIRMGVNGGLPLMLLFIARLVAGFAGVGKTLSQNQNAPREQQFLIWIMGSILLGHVVTFFSVAYFDPAAVLFLELNLAAIGSAAACWNASPEEAPVPIQGEVAVEA